MSKLEKKIQKKSLGLYLLLKTLKRVCAKDKEYIDLHLRMHQRPDVLMLNYSDSVLPDGNIVYYINEAGQGLGFFAEMKSLLCKLIYAEGLGLKPTVFWGKDFLYFDEQFSCKIENAFEYYFEPIGEMNESKAVGCSTCSNAFHGGYVETIYQSKGYDVPDNLKQEFVRVIQKYIHIKKELEDKFRTDFTNLVPKGNGKVLGIHYRGTDYKVGYNVHPVQIELLQLENMIAKLIAEGMFQYVFFATDDAHAAEYLKEKFGDCIVQYKDVIRSDGMVSVAFSESDREYHHYKLGLEVLRDMYTLSMCDGLIGGLSQVSFFAQLFKKSRDEEYEYLEIIDNGIHSNGVAFSSEK